MTSLWLIHSMHFYFPAKCAWLQFNITASEPLEDPLDDLNLRTFHHLVDSYPYDKDVYVSQPDGMAELYLYYDVIKMKWIVAIQVRST